MADGNNVKTEIDPNEGVTMIDGDNYTNGDLMKLTEYELYKLVVTLLLASITGVKIVNDNKDSLLKMCAAINQNDDIRNRCSGWFIDGNGWVTENVLTGTGNDMVYALGESIKSPTETRVNIDFFHKYYKAERYMSYLEYLYPEKRITDDTEQVIIEATDKALKDVEKGTKESTAYKVGKVALIALTAGAAIYAGIKLYDHFGAGDDDVVILDETDDDFFGDY